MTEVRTSRQKPRVSACNKALPCAGITLAIILGRLWLLLTFGGSIPFWDQWGGENSLFEPAINGTLSLSQLLAAHNEHRIFWTRLTTVALFFLNGKQWDNTVEAGFTTILFGMAAFMAMWVASRSLSKRGFAVFSLISLLGALLPYAWENLLVGFQSQFTYCTLFSMAALYVAACREVRPATLIWGLLFLGGAFLSMATGVLAALATAVVYLTRSIMVPGATRKWARVGLASSISISIAGKILTPTPAHHAVLHASDLATMVDALGTAFSWPLPWHLMLLVMAPVAAWSLRAFVRNEFRRADFFFLGVLSLGILNAIAIAYSRGGDLKEVPSRYLDGLFFISLGSAYFSASVLEASRRSIRLVLGYVPLLAIMSGLAFQGVYQVHFLRERAYFIRMETVNLAQFLGGESKALFDKPHAHVPYPDPAALVKSLQKADQRPILPASVMGLAPAPKPDHGCSIKAGVGNRYIFTCPGTEASSVLPSAGLLSAWLMQARQIFAPSAFSTPTIARSMLPVGDSKCAIDSINEKSTTGHPIDLTVDSPVRIKGWGKYTLGVNWLRVQPVRIALRSNGSSYEFSSGLRRFERPDVSAALASPRYLWSGFDAFIDIRSLPPGEYEILVATGSSPYCESGHRLKLTRANIPLVEH